MTEVIGPMTIVQRALPTGVDGAKIAQWQMRQGISFQAFVNRLALALGDFNAELMRNWGWLFSITEDLVLEYPQGGAVTALPEITDLDIPDMVHGQTIGHMIDLKSYGGAVGGSWMYWRDAREAQIVSTIQTIVNQARERFEVALLTRAMTNTENSVGSVGYDVPFVRGSGGNVDFIPPSRAGEDFLVTHDHFIGCDSGSKDFEDVFNELAETLEEHGHSAPFRALVSKANVTTIAALTKFVQLVDNIITVIDRGGETSGNQLYARGVPVVTEGVFGHFQSQFGPIELHSTARIPTGFVGLYKPYGENNVRNPLKVRVHPEAGFGLYVVPEASGNDQFPIKRVVMPFEFGVSVGQDRTNGAVGYLVSGGTYANPTIS